MDKCHNIRIEKLNDNQFSFASKVFIDDCQVNNIYSLDFHLSVDEVPKVEICCNGFPNIDGEYCAEFEFSPTTIEEAISVLENSGYEVKKIMEK